MFGTTTMSAILLMDVENLYRSIARKFQRRLDFEKYTRNLEERFGCPLSVKMAYGSQKPKDVRSFINFLKSLGFAIKYDENVDWNVAMTIVALELAKIGDLVILGSNNKSLSHLVQNLQGRGVRTFVSACCIHPVLRQMSEYQEIEDTLLFPVPESPVEPTDATQ